MPWLESSAMDDRLRFAADWLANEVSKVELCERYGISRKTGYKWMDRYEAEGPSGLADRSRAPLTHGRATPTDLVEKLVELRRARSTWGPRKLVAKLEQLHPELTWPSHSTAHEILKRAGLVSNRRVHRHPPLRLGELVTPERPNHVWSVDHKGWVKLGDGQRCEPLTMVDNYSRFVLAISAGGSTRDAQTRPVMEEAFRTYGLPEVIRSDNGPPFASASITGLTSLSVWWIKLGMRPERIDPGSPQQNGRLERFHLTLLEAMRPPAADRAIQAQRFEAFRQDYNHERPHQALKQVPPDRFYRRSPRPMPDRLPEPRYRRDQEPRSVRSNGEIKFKGGLVHISSALAGETVALEEIERGWRLWFYTQPIGILDHTGQRLLPIQPG